MQTNILTTLLATALFACCLNLANSLECYQCNSALDPNCITNLTALTAVTCSTTCITYQATNLTLIRDCSDACPDGVNCQQCSNADNCNNNLVCQSCQGQQDCSVPSKLTESLAICSSGDVCITQLNDNSTISRGCGTAASCTDSAKCATCDVGNCNIQVFPTDRLQCYTCSGDSCNAVNNSTLTPCGLNNAQCYTLGSNATDMQRGCTSDSGTKCTADSTDANCLLCNNETGCNNLTYTRSGGSCVTCDNCSAAQVATVGAACPESNYTQSVGCYTQTKDNVVSRGCLNALALDFACTNETQCSSCDTANCNIDLVEVDTTFKCQRCNNINFDECTKGSVEAQACDNTTETKCFAGMWGDLVVRDCLDQASALMEYQCVQEVANCKVCDTSGCNKWTYSAASFIQISLGLIMGLLAIQFV
ncbi:protein psiF [Drosophila tropicalis]|uniref:protein psiF n=1 Tax=Drosophila tropicalis TaxID=46794 RepID=UPI0035AB96A3